MSRPEEEEVLFVYIVVALHVVSLVLVRVDDEVQRPVCYVSKLLHEAEVHYLPLEKAILAMVHATQEPLITSRLTPLWSSPNFLFNHCFRKLTT